MRHHQVEAFESRLSQLLADVDCELERRHPDTFPKRGSRPDAGTTCHPQYDGLYSLTAAFSAGIGSVHGPGYTVTLRIATPGSPAPEAQSRLLEEARGLIAERLRSYFPNHRLTLAREPGGTLKIIGDLGVRPID